MQTQVEISPAQPPTPPTPPPPSASIQIDGGPGIPGHTISLPLNNGDVRWLRARKSELKDQLTLAIERREGVADELVGTSGPNRAGLEQRLGILDQRIVRLEAELAQTEEILTSAPTNFLAATEVAQSRDGGEPEAQVIVPSVLIVFVGFPLAVAYARRIWKRSSTPRVSPVDAGRLERIEQAIEAIAVEVERVSEGQRFVTKLLSDTNRAALSLPVDR